jgi:hypothetical protein
MKTKHKRPRSAFLADNPFPSPITGGLFLPGEDAGNPRVARISSRAYSRLRRGRSGLGRHTTPIERNRYTAFTGQTLSGQKDAFCIQDTAGYARHSSWLSPRCAATLRLACFEGAAGRRSPGLRNRAEKVDAPREVRNRSVTCEPRLFFVQTWSFVALCCHLRITQPSGIIRNHLRIDDVAVGIEINELSRPDLLLRNARHHLLERPLPLEHCVLFSHRSLRLLFAADVLLNHRQRGRKIIWLLVPANMSASCA